MVRAVTISTIAAVAVLAPGCHEDSDDSARTVAPPRSGPPGQLRVALPELQWPLDPARVAGRDATTVALALLATPLRVDSATGALKPGLCRDWKSDENARTWRFRCRRASAVAAALRRVARMPDSPSHWLFAPVASITVQGSETLVVGLRFPWRRFPYALTVPAAAPRDAPGPFRLVAGSRDRIVAERPGLRLVFLRLEPRLAVSAFRRGLVDEAPVPRGQLRALRADPTLVRELRVRPIRGVDLVDLGGVIDAYRELRLAYWRTAERGDYEALVTEFSAPQAFGLVRTAGAAERASPRLFRAARREIPSLPRVVVPIRVEGGRDARYATDVLWSAWRDVGLQPRVVSGTSSARAARFRRVIAAYPHPEGLLAAVLLERTDSAAARAALLDAFRAADPLRALTEADRELQADAHVVPIAWVSDARLVSRRLEGWRHDALGNVDYVRVRTR